MHARFIARLAVLVVLLSGCLAPALLLPSQSQLMWALLKPLVGFDPNEVRLFEHPLVKDRMVALLGPNYDTTMQLLRTANKVQQEGPLFYVISRHTPVPELAQRAGLVWNSDNNQMAIALLKGDVAEVFAETVQKRVDDSVAAAEQSARDRVDAIENEARDGVQGQLDAAVPPMPVWPSVMAQWANPRKAIEQRIESGVERALDATVTQPLQRKLDAATGVPAAPAGVPEEEAGEPPASDDEPEPVLDEEPSDNGFREESAEDLLWSTPERAREPGQ
jgi:hypothetical protein